MLTHQAFLLACSGEARFFVTEVESRFVTDVDASSFEREVRGPHPPGLARAALLFAREIAYPDLTPSLYLAQLDDWAAAIRRGFSARDTVLTRVRHLSDFLFGAIDLRGNREDYSDPRNSYLNEVMTRRLGLPISLSVIFIEAAERIGLQVDGVGTPGHFIVSVHAEAGRYFFDPFNGGVEITEDEAAQLVQQSTGHTGPFDPAWLDPSPARDIIARMLNNLRHVYVQLQAWPEAIAAVDHLRILQPHTAHHLRDLGVLHHHNGSPRQAANLLEAYLARASNAPDAAAARSMLATILDEYTRLN